MTIMKSWFRPRPAGNTPELIGRGKYFTDAATILAAEWAEVEFQVPNFSCRAIILPSEE